MNVLQPDPEKWVRQDAGAAGIAEASVDEGHCQQTDDAAES